MIHYLLPALLLMMGLASIGGAMLTAESLSLDELLTQADQAMYRAKARGRDCVVIED